MMRRLALLPLLLSLALTDAAHKNLRSGKARKQQQQGLQANQHGNVLKAEARVKAKHHYGTVPQDYKDMWAIAGRQAMPKPRIVIDNSITNGDDKIGVYLQPHGVCVIDAEESGTEVADWLNNAWATDMEIYAVKATVTGRDKVCGCEKYGILYMYCKQYKSCRRKKVLGEGMSGFVDIGNRVGPKLHELITDECTNKGATRYRFIGYSRGGGIAALLAYVWWAEKLVPQGEIDLMTFGAPRALDTATAQKAQQAGFPAIRLVHHKDPVPKVPPSSLGYKHYGALVHVKEGGLTPRPDTSATNRDKPHVSWWKTAATFIPGNWIGRKMIVDEVSAGIEDHTSYSDWLGKPKE